MNVSAQSIAILLLVSVCAPTLGAAQTGAGRDGTSGQVETGSPAAASKKSCTTIAAAAKDAGLSTFLDALKRAQLLKDFQDDKNLLARTVFAPSNEAFDTALKKLKVKSLDDLGPKQLASVLELHVALGSSPAKSLKNGQQLQTQYEPKRSGAGKVHILSTDSSMTQDSTSSSVSESKQVSSDNSGNAATQGIVATPPAAGKSGSGGAGSEAGILTIHGTPQGREAKVISVASKGAGGQKADIIKPDAATSLCGGSVVHVIDHVLLPPGFFPKQKTSAPIIPIIGTATDASNMKKPDKQNKQSKKANKKKGGEQNADNTPASLVLG